MKHKIQLPTLETIEIEYNDKVYDPNYTQHDALVVADAFVRKSKPDLKVLDLGCGSGKLGLSLKFMHPKLDITLSDNSADAIKLAKKNAKTLGIKANFVKSDMFESLKGDYDMILTNLPSFTDDQMEETHSPAETVYDNDLEHYKELFNTKKTKVIVHEIQSSRQKELYLIATGRGWKEIMKTDYAYAWMKKKAIHTL